MPENISPYALLCACKPKPTPTVVTAYDLYSQAQRSSEPSSPPNAPAAPQADAPAPPQPYPRWAAPAQRTHYIADIQSRHSAALRRAPMQSRPLT